MGNIFEANWILHPPSSYIQGGQNYQYAHGAIAPKPGWQVDAINTTRTTLSLNARLPKAHLLRSIITTQPDKYPLAVPQVARHQTRSVANNENKHRFLLTVLHRVGGCHHHSNHSEPATIPSPQTLGVPSNNYTLATSMHLDAPSIISNFNVSVPESQMEPETLAQSSYSMAITASSVPVPCQTLSRLPTRRTIIRRGDADGLGKPRGRAGGATSVLEMCVIDLLRARRLGLIHGHTVRHPLA